MLTNSRRQGTTANEFFRTEETTNKEEPLRHQISIRDSSSCKIRNPSRAKQDQRGESKIREEEQPLRNLKRHISRETLN
ncbi:unnamed protein product [Linum trigynum]|uniref:Uncharacterized protein n=1 Tax=Linum trigynum TaxID=586398 RepID=A0AAV2GUN8_9ROSI